MGRVTAKRATRQTMSALVAVFMVASFCLGIARIPLAAADPGSARLSLPWSPDDPPWVLLKGIHSWSGKIQPASSLDFAPSPSGGIGNVLAAGDGVAYRDGNCAPNFVRIDHGNGLHTSYYHITDIPDSLRDGTPVRRGQFLGRTGEALPCGGRANGAHVHFTVWNFSGQFDRSPRQEANVVGMDIGGWKIEWNGRLGQACLRLLTTAERRCVGERIPATNSTPAPFPRPEMPIPDAIAPPVPRQPDNSRGVATPLPHPFPSGMLPVPQPGSRPPAVLPAPRPRLSVSPDWPARSWGGFCDSGRLATISGAGDWTSWLGCLLEWLWMRLASLPRS